MKLFTFHTNGDLLGLSSEYVHRVVDDVNITPVCLMPPFYLGVLYYRGELFDVVDIGLLLDKKTASIDESRRLMVIRWNRQKLAIAPGVIRGLVWIEEDSGKEASITHGGQIIRRITPEEIWEGAMAKTRQMHNAQ